MVLALWIFAVAFAAFGIWLVVRIVNRRERWAKWMAVGLMATVLSAYPLTFAPAYRFFYIKNFANLQPWEGEAFWSYYQPVIWLKANNAPFRHAMRRYEKLWGID